MSVKALETGAAAARQLALDVFYHSASSIEERLNALANALEDAARRLPPEGGGKAGCAILDAGREEERVTRKLVERWGGENSCFRRGWYIKKEAAVTLVSEDGVAFMFAAGLLRWHCGAIWLTDKHRELWAEVVKERSLRAIVEAETKGGDRG